MKRIIYFILLSSVAYGYGQTEEDYAATIKQVKENYNAENPKGLFSLFSKSLQSSFSLEKLTERMADDMKNRGKINEFSLLLEDELGKSYLISFSESDLLLMMQIDSSKKLKVFEFKEY